MESKALIRFWAVLNHSLVMLCETIYWTILINKFTAEIILCWLFFRIIYQYTNGTWSENVWGSDWSLLKKIFFKHGIGTSAFICTYLKSVWPCIIKLVWEWFLLTLCNLHSLKDNKLEITRFNALNMMQWFISFCYFIHKHGYSWLQHTHKWSVTDLDVTGWSLKVEKKETFTH